MHAGQHYKLKELLFWTRRDIYALTALAIVPTILFQVAGWFWLAIPWQPVAVLGTAAAFIVGFRNNATYDRAWEARKIWGAIVNSSRSWGIMAKDFVRATPQNPISDEERKLISKELIYRHVAWLTALRYQLREPRAWETMAQPHNVEFRRTHFMIAECNVDAMHTTLRQHLAASEVEYIMGKKNKATQIISLQSKQLRELSEQGLIENYRYVEMERMLVDFYEQQGKCERIKNYPYPRQFATLNKYFIRLFVLMMPFGMLQVFSGMAEYMVWFTIPFSALVGWVFTTLEKIGESTENPFEGNANDVPITALSRTIEIDLKDMLDEDNLPEPIKPAGSILT
ncbi:MAG: multidrug transporter [Taibaiella sp.]|nr:multidrug transporter [Taibaiella sp.]